MNIYEKLVATKNTLYETGLKKSGFNKFSNYHYFELADFLPTIVKCQAKYAYCTAISFDNDMASVTAINIEDPSDRHTVTCPMSSVELKGMHKVQNDGAVQTYLRRYLYVNLFDLVESDAVDASDTTQNKAKGLDKPTNVPASIKGLLISDEKIATLSAMAKESKERAMELKNLLARYDYSKIAEIKESDYDAIISEYSTKLPFSFE